LKRNICEKLIRVFLFEIVSLISRAREAPACTMRASLPGLGRYARGRKSPGDFAVVLKMHPEAGLELNDPTELNLRARVSEDLLTPDEGAFKVTRYFADQTCGIKIASELIQDPMIKRCDAQNSF
jgi:hypothetical protein